MYCSVFSKGTISLRTPCTLYLVVVVVPRETVRFEDEKTSKRRFDLKFFRVFSKRDNPEIFVLHFFLQKN